MQKAVAEILSDILTIATRGDEVANDWLVGFTIGLGDMVANAETRLFHSTASTDAIREDRRRRPYALHPTTATSRLYHTRVRVWRIPATRASARRPDDVLLQRSQQFDSRNNRLGEREVADTNPIVGPTSLLAATRIALSG
jgi:hypothetical protein